MLSQADEARTSTDKAGAREKVQLAILGSYGEDGTLDEEKLMLTLQEMPEVKVGKQNIQEENLEVTVDDAYTFEITKEGEVKDKGTVTTTPPVENEVIPGVIVEGSNKTYIDADGDTAIIPVGFAIVPNLNDVSEGLVISDKENDTGDEGNQFVWIPVKGNYEATTTYEDTNVSLNRQNDIGYLPLTDAEIGIVDDADDEQKRQLTLNKETELVTTNLIKKYGVGGFYISRYEAGDDSVTISKTERTEASGTTGKLVSKKNEYVYNYIKQTEAKEKAKEFIGKDNANVKSGLCTGIQWDMVMAFINRKKDGKGNDYIVTQELKDTSSESSSNRHTGSLATSGQNLADKVCNIYDLEGNCFEYVAEKSAYDVRDPYVHRGGGYGAYPASYRCGINGTAFSTISFHFVLYVM